MDLLIKKTHRTKSGKPNIIGSKGWVNSGQRAHEIDFEQNAEKML